MDGQTSGFKKVSFHVAYHADQIKLHLSSTSSKPNEKDLQEVEHTRFLCSRADHEYMYTHIYMIYKSMTAHKL